MSKRVLSVLVILLTLTLFFPLSCSDKEQVTEEIIRPVRYTQVFSTGSDRMRSFSGSVRSEEESKLSFKVSGTIINLPVKLGDVVKKGQLIAQLDPKDYQLRVQESEASLTQVRAEARNAAANYERVRQLYENQNASLSDLDIARTQAESTQAQVRSIEKQLELTRFQLSYTKLSAPVDGSIASVDIEINENVNAGDTVALLTACCKLEVEVAIPESLISGIRDGDSVTVKLDALPGKSFSAVITEVGVAPTEFATTYPVTVRLDRTDPDIRSGMAAEVAFGFGSSGSVKRFIVPPIAVLEDRDGRFVYIVEPDEAGLGLVRKRLVTVGELTSEGLEITDGLSDGDLVVIAGVSNISDGLKVKVPELKGQQP